MKRGCSYTLLVGFFLFIPLLFNVQIKDFQINSKRQEIADATKKENLFGKRKGVVVKSLSTAFKGEAVDKLDDNVKTKRFSFLTISPFLLTPRLARGLGIFGSSCVLIGKTIFWLDMI